MIKPFQCPSCQTKMRFDDANVRPVKCPKCSFVGSVSDYWTIAVRNVYCPSCNVSLQMEQTVYESNRSVTCPKCKNTANAKSYLSQPKSKVQPTDNSGKTEFKTLKTGVSSQGAVYAPCVLLWQSGDCRTKRIELQKGENTIGRKHPHSRSVIQLDADDMYMSKNHAVIEVIVRPDFTIEHRLSDNRSANGTYHGDNRLEQDDIIILTPGDTVRFGRTVFKVVNE